MYDKTIFESGACGCIPLASSLDFAKEADSRCSFQDGNAEDLARKLEVLLGLSQEERNKIITSFQAYVTRNDIHAYGRRIVEELQ
jgi:hypothetical protein